jgi:flagellar biosynthetic protein FlhB
MPDYAGEKNLDPTPHRRQQARREGHVAKSRDLGSAVLLLTGLVALTSLGGGLVGFMVEFCREQLGGEAWLTTNPQMIVDQWNHVLWTLGRCVLPFLGLICLAGVAVNVLQVGFLFLPQRLAFDFSRLDPLQGLRRIFSSSGMVQLGFGMLKLTIVLAVAGMVLYNDRAEILRLTELSPAGIGVQISQILFRTAIKVGAALFVLALLDYAYQWWRHEQDMKMTPQELREELRNLEGNPQVIARRKQVQRDLAVKSGEWRVESIRK